MFANAASDVQGQYFIHQILGPIDLDKCELRGVELHDDRLASQVLKLVHGARRPAQNFRNPKHFERPVLLEPLANFIFTLLILALSPTEYTGGAFLILSCRFVIFCHMRSTSLSLTCDGAIPVLEFIVVTHDELVQHVHLAVGVVPREPLAQFKFQRPVKKLHDGTFHVWIPAQPHFNAIVTQ